MLVVGRNILIVFFVAAAANLSAAGPELDLEIGFSGKFHSGTVVPVTVVVRGADGSFRGELVVEAVSGTSLERGFRYSLRRSVNLSDGISGIYRFSLPLEVSSYPLTVRLERGGFTAAAEESELRPLNTERPIVVCLSRRPSLDSLIPALAEYYGGSVEMTYPRGEFLPANALAWESAGMVLWHDFPPDFLDGDSSTALASWISAGGTLIVVPGPWMAGKTLPGGLPPGKIGSPVTSGGHLLYPPEDGTLPVPSASGEDEIPSAEAVEYRFGRGRVIYAPWDAASPQYPPEEREDFWIRTLGTAGGKGSFDFASLEHAVAEAAFLEEEPLLSPPAVPLAVLLLFAAASAAILFVGRSSDSSKLLSFRLVSIMVLSAAVSVWAAMKPRTIPPQRLEILYAWPSGDLLSSSVLRFVSPAPASVNVPLDADAVPLPVEGRDTRISGDAGGRVLEDLELEPWIASDVSIRGIVPGPESAETGSIGKTTPSGSDVIRNNGAEAWFDLVSVSADGAIPVVDRLDPGSVVRVPGFSASADFAAGEGEYARIVEGVVDAYRSGAAPGDGVVLARGRRERGEAFRLIVFLGDRR